MKTSVVVVLLGVGLSGVALGGSLSPAEIEAWKAEQAALHDPAAAGAPASGDAAPAYEGHAVMGVVTDADTGAPVADLWVYVGDAELRTGADGAFTADLPPGTYEITVAGKGYASLSVPGVVVEDGKTARVNASVAKAEAGDDDTVVVESHRSTGSATVLLEERKASAQVTDAVGSEQIARSGDTSAAAAVRRVTGLSVVGGKYVYVRGLGDRYSSTSLDGMTLPSPEPERRVVPLDLFPAGFLDSVVVQKTYSPDMPGQFGGGVVTLRTREAPDHLVAAVNVGGTYRHGTSLVDGPRDPVRGPTDAFGVDGGFRDLPDEVQQASDAQPLHERDMFSTSGFTAQELEKYGEALPNRWGLASGMAAPDSTLSVAVGDGATVGPVKVGALGGLVWRDTWQRQRLHHAYMGLAADGTLEPDSEYDFDTLMNTVQTGAIATVSGEVGKQKIRSTTLLGRITDDEARTYEGYSFDVNGDIEVDRTRWIERQLLTEQLSGEHGLPLGLELDWHAGFATATRDQPDQLETQRDHYESTDQWLLVDDEIFYSALADHARDLGADVTIPLGFGGDAHPAIVKVGVADVHKAREVDTRRFFFREKGPKANDPAITSLPTDQIFTPDTIGPDGFQLEENTQATDNYTAGQSTRAVYALIDAPIGPVRVTGGARLERSTQAVSTFQPFVPDAEPVTATLATTDVLPSATITVPMGETMQVRAGYGRTLDRPDFRELSPAVYTDVTGGYETHGNPDLQRATIDNVDARWEWYPSDGESLSIGAFYKRFQSPIETTVIASVIHSQTWSNADAARDLGVEADFRHALPLKGTWAAGNLAVIASHVDLGDAAGVATSKGRPLQGQSPYVANLTVGWDDAAGWSATAAFNVVGPRIVDVGSQGLPDVYEKPAPVLDVSASHVLGKGFEVGVRGGNLLDSRRVLVQGGQEVETWKAGWTAGASLTWRP